MKLNLPVISLSKLNEEPNLKHAFFTRNGGFSKGIYDSLNVRSSSKDDKINIAKNRQTVANFFDISSNDMVFLNQQHGNNVVIIDTIPSNRFEADGLVTNYKNIALCIVTADCAPVLFFDYKANIIGAAHAGWKGSVAGIIENTVDAMIKLGANPENIISAIGPSIGFDSYEVQKDFKNNINEECFFKEKNKKIFFDLKGFVASKLDKSGIKNIYVLPNDTFQEESNFFSYRRSFLKGEKDYACQVSAICLK